MNITELLQDAIYFDNQVIEQRDLLMGPTAHLQEILVRCDQSLTACYHPAVDYAIDQQSFDQGDHAQLVERFVKTLHWFLLFSARKQWTHLVVMSEADYQQLVSAKSATHLCDQDKEYLTIKYFLFSSYYTHRQADFRHAWHLLLKFGLVDLRLSEQEIMAVHKQLMKDNLTK